MPKEKVDINHFYGGLHNAYADEQTPINAIVGGSSNVYIDKLGRLSLARGNKSYLKTSNGPEPVKFQKRFSLDAGPKILTYDGSSFHIHKDVMSGSDEAEEVPVLNSSGHDIQRLSAQASNTALHIGTGNQQVNKPLWMGKHQHFQFGHAPSDDYAIEDAECRGPESTAFPGMYKVVVTDEGYVGIQRLGTQIHKFNDEGESESSEDNFNILTAIALDTEAADNHHVVVFDENDNAVHRIDLTTMATVATLSIDTSVVESSEYPVTDMMVADGRIWLAKTNINTHKADMSDFIYSIEYSATSDNMSLANHSFNIVPEDAIGNFDGDKLIFFAPPLMIDDLGYENAESIWENIVGSNVGDDAGCYLKIPPLCLMQDSSGVAIFGVPHFYGYYSYEGVVQNQFWRRTIPEDEAKPGFFADADFTGKYATQAGFHVRSDDSHMDGGNIHMNYLTAFNTIDWRNNGDFPDESNPIPESIWAAEVPSAIFSSGSTVYLGFKSSEQLLAIRNFDTSNYTVNTIQSYGPDLSSSDVFYITVDTVFIRDGDDYYFWSTEQTQPGMYQEGDIVSGQITSLELISEAFRNITAELVDNGFTHTDDLDRLFYRVSYLYDGISESPLGARTVLDVSENDKGVLLKIYLDTSISRRVSHVNIYRAQSLMSGAEQGAYRLVTSIPIELEINKEDGKYVYEYTDRNGIELLGPSYEASSGLPENLNHTLPHYRLSELMDDQLFVADCWHPQIEHGHLFLFRSNRYSVNVFNWAENVTRLPSTPTAMVSFQGRIIVFDRYDAHIVNPESMHIEETVQGMGVASPDAIVRTPTGLFVGGVYHAYMMGGQGRQTISTPIEYNSDFAPGWWMAGSSSQLKAGYDELNNWAVFAAPAKIDGDDKILIFCYDPERQLWLRHIIEGSELHSLETTYHGEVLVGIDNEWKWLFRGDNPIVPEQSVLLRRLYFDQSENQKWVYGVMVGGDVPGLGLAVNGIKLEGKKLDHNTMYFEVPDEARKMRYADVLLDLVAGEVIETVSVVHRKKVIYDGKDV